MLRDKPELLLFPKAIFMSAIYIGKRQPPGRTDIFFYGDSLHFCIQTPGLQPPEKHLPSLGQMRDGWVPWAAEQGKL